ncbi:alkene reductase [Legionella brunensis]|uniref:N-ethylmaleimide reductase, FMN-linked n=1 Tax=Legionella brunensis TaxID=29422 RepID=A0A0W0S0I3_9GAMM|nr:alkene reductase [Legionella brunensis]KTC76914.1 N-ethylmaleimide reductase, FMN-linked [Legionella brunensis]
MSADEITASDLFLPTMLGSLTLANRIIMAPLTRSRAGKGDVQGPMNAEYYAQRASAGLIISEATQISQQGKGYAFTPGIYSEEQIAGWKLVTDAVHAKKGLIFAQLWHVGRISHPDLQPDNQLPVAPSAIKPMGQAYTETGFKDLVTPRALETVEIPEVIEQYVHAARCAKQAGFDGIELHAANGYLIDQFICDKTNKRTDCYGGSLQNRVRFLLELLEELAMVWPGERTGVRLSPVSPANDIADSKPMETFSYVVKAMNPFNLLYLHCVEGITIGPRKIPADFNFATLRSLFNGQYMANNGYDFDLAIKARQENAADLICFGRAFIGNPDLVTRLQKRAPLNEAPKELWYAGGAHGYIDWPTWDEQKSKM